MTDELKFTCDKCQTKSASAFCPNCGNKLSPNRMRTLQEVEMMQELIDKALKVKSKTKDGGLPDLMIAIVAKICLEWVKGKQNTNNPVEFILLDDQYKTNEEAQAILELAKMRN